MADFAKAPLQNQFETQVVGEISSSSTVPFNITVKTAISFTPQASGFRIICEPGTSKEEGMIVTGVSGTTWTVGTRGVPSYKGGASSATTHGGGTKIIITDTWSTFDDMTTVMNTKADATTAETISGDWTFTGDEIFSGSLRCPVYATAVARATGIPTPANGMEYYQTDTGKFYDYTAGSWVERVSGGTFPNGSVTVAGKFEEATVAEQGTATATGGTGARLLPANANIVKASSGAGDENKLAILSADGKFADGFQNIAETSADTLTGGGDAGSLHTHAAPFASMTAGEDVDGSTTPQAVYISDGTNGRTAGSYYKTDANDATNTDSPKFFGFAKGNITTGNTDSIYYGGIVSGFTGLTIGADQYLSDTAGGVSETPSTTLPIKIGRAKSATEILIEKEATVHVSGLQTITSISTGNQDTVIECGFRPTYIEVQYKLEGIDTGVDEFTIGTAWYKGTTYSHGLRLCDSIANGSITTATIKQAGGAITVGGVAGTSNQVTLTMNAVSDTNYTFRIASAVIGGAAAKNQFLNITAYK